MATNASTTRARRRRNIRNRVLMTSYDSAMRDLFPQDYRVNRRKIVRMPQQVAEIEARINLYSVDAEFCKPIQYIANSIRLIDPAPGGNRK